MGFKQTTTHRFGKASYHQIGLVRGQFGNVPMDKWLSFLQQTGFHHGFHAGIDAPVEGFFLPTHADESPRNRRMLAIPLGLQRADSLTGKTKNFDGPHDPPVGASPRKLAGTD